MRISDWSSDVCSSDLLLPAVVSAFDRQHAYPDIADYELLLDRSAEAAWIATEGNAFNHATSRVPDVAAEAECQRASGRPIKDRVEISASGRVRQTRSEEHTSELQSLMRISYAVFCLKKKIQTK